MHIFFLHKKIEKMWLTSTELGGNALDALENITKKADKDHKKKTHLPKMATSLSRTLRNVSEFVIKERNVFSRASSSWGQNPLCALIRLQWPKYGDFVVFAISSTKSTSRNTHFRNSRENGTSCGCSDFWDCLSGQALLMIGRWYSRQPITNHKNRLSTQTIPEFVAPKFCTHSPLQFLE